MKKLLFGIVWCVVFYFGICIAAGAIVGAMAGTHYPHDPAMAAHAGQQAGIKIVNDYGVYFVAGAVVLSVLGSGFGVLPGTRQNRSSSYGH